tara:strand:- start:454 stop:834 length:381 start_codon:yes stop_codon:yes gene_type:complete
MKQQYEIDYEGLKGYLEVLTRERIDEGALVKGHAISDIELFYKTDAEKSKITYDQVIGYGMPFLVDAIGNDLSIVVLTRRKYKLPTGRVIGAKFDRTIIDDCREIYGSPINDYFIIPDTYLTKIKP